MNEQAWKEQAARIIDPSSWAVMDGYLKQMLRQYKGKHIGYDPEAFKHKESMAIAEALWPLVQQAIAAERGEPVAPIWRSGVGFGATVLDIVRKRFSKTRSPAVARFNAALDEALQAAFDMSRSANVENYEEAQAVEKNIAAAIRSLKESDNGAG